MGVAMVCAMGVTSLLASVGLPAGSASGDTPEVTIPGGFVGMPPGRLLDTRSGVGAPLGEVAAGGVVNLQVTDALGIPATGVAAVVLNVTVISMASPGYITVYPDGAPRPTTSNLNFTAGQIVPNLVVAKVGAGGRVNLFNGSTGSVHLVADVSGYHLSGPPTAAGAFGALDPVRLLDTRYGTGAARAAVGPYGIVHLQVAGRGRVPSSGVSAVTLNVTAVAPTHPGFVTAYGTGTVRAWASNLNFVPGQTVPNLVITPVGGGRVDLYNGSNGTVNLIADVSGYYLAGTATLPGALGSLPPTG
jgi:hypothetical protein